MLSKCANPECLAPFIYLRDGRLYQIDTAAGPQLVTKSKPAHRIEYFWLCGQCASSMTLSFQRGKGVVMVPLQRETARSAAAS
jgi:hypothetical protein